MGTCEVCGNSYDKAFSVSVAGGAAHTFDSGHGHEAHGKMFCCAQCARHAGGKAQQDRA